jgi:hypothetical protein
VPAAFERVCVNCDGGVFWCRVCGALVNKKGQGVEREREREREMAQGPGMDTRQCGYAEVASDGDLGSGNLLTSYKQGDLISGFPRYRCTIAGCSLELYRKGELSSR